ncbi:hypothetical protein EDC04DRAFT_2625083 [Pisolithus marmoratus]|nr:hypothetical protein EDC04DRAFT_2625083 [Pisolithus marmoratus]
MRRHSFLASLLMFLHGLLWLRAGAACSRLYDPNSLRLGHRSPWDSAHSLIISRLVLLSCFTPLHYGWIPPCRPAYGTFIFVSSHFPTLC